MCGNDIEMCRPTFRDITGDTGYRQLYEQEIKGQGQLQSAHRGQADQNHHTQWPVR